MPEASTTLFAIYHLHYKNKFVGNWTWIFVCAINCFYFLRSWSNFSVVFFLTYNSGIYTAESSLVSKKRELLRIFLYFLSYFLSLLSLFFNLTLAKMRLIIFKCLSISKCITISKWQLNFLALANFPLLANCLLVKLTSQKVIQKIKIITKDCKNLISI